MDKPPPTNPPPLTLISGKSQPGEFDERMIELASKVCCILSEKMLEKIEQLMAPVTELMAPVAELEAIKKKAFLTEIEVALLFSVSARTLRNDRWRGLGPRYMKDGSKVLYAMEDLVSYYNGRLIRTKDSL